MLTCCWATDEFTLENGATTVMPGTNALLRHPNEDEIKTAQNMVTMDCPAGSIAIWDGRVWHANAPKNTDGQRVVLHTSYQRMVVRPNEDFSDVADEMIDDLFALADNDSNGSISFDEFVILMKASDTHQTCI